MQEQFTSREVAKLAEVTLRQLQWLDERKIVAPVRNGHRRVYSMKDLTEVAVIGELRHRGFSLQRVRKVMRFLHKEFGKRLAETVSGTSEYHLLTDGRTLYLETSARQIVDILKNTRQPLLAICLSDKVRQVRAVIRNGKKHRPSVAASAARKRAKAS
jgi:DNA-binding transcriptional MerR regulator